MDPILADGWSRLHFVDVNIAGLSREVAALNDSGAQICVIRADLTENLQLPVVGRTSIRGVTDSVVNTDLVSLGRGQGHLTKAKILHPMKYLRNSLQVFCTVWPVKF